MTHPAAPMLHSSAGSTTRKEQARMDYNAIIRDWYTTKKAAEITGLRHRTVLEYCRQGKFRAVQIGRVWYIEPTSAHTFQKSKTGRKRSDGEE